MGRHSDALVLREWQIWHVYSSFLSRPVSKLDTLARNLVTQGLAESAFVSDGRAFWSGDDPRQRVRAAGRRATSVGEGPLAVTLETDFRRAKITLPAGPTGYAFEGLYQAGALRYSELMLWGDSSLLPSYLRACVGPCTLVGDEYALRLYPQILVFETGVVMVEFRMFGPERPVYVHEFIRRHLNASFTDFREALAPPGLVAWAPTVLADPRDSRWYRRPKTALSIWLHRREVARRAELVEDEDFAFQEIAIARSEDAPETMHTLALTIMEIVAYLEEETRAGLSWLLRGPKSTLDLGEYWSGRPHVHLLRFAGQAETAVENERAFADDLGSIVARNHFKRPGEGREHLPASSRPLGDFGAYLSLGGTLWVHTRRSLREYGDVPWADRNRGHLVYEHQVKAELLEYGYALHRRIADRALSTGDDMGLALTAERDLAAFEWAFHDVGRFGEIRDLLKQGWNAMGVPVIRDRITEVLRVRQAEISHRDSVRANRRTAFLAILAGLLAVPPLADAVVKPLWRLFGLPLPSNPDSASLLHVGVAFGLVIAVIWAAYLWTRRVS
jgi:hypothetical protein